MHLTLNGRSSFISPLMTTSQLAEMMYRIQIDLGKQQFIRALFVQIVFGSAQLFSQANEFSCFYSKGRNQKRDKACVS